MCVCAGGLSFFLFFTHTTSDKTILLTYHQDIKESEVCVFVCMSVCQSVCLSFKDPFKVGLPDG